MILLVVAKWLLREFDHVYFREYDSEIIVLEMHDRIR